MAQQQNTDLLIPYRISHTNFSNNLQELKLLVCSRYFEVTLHYVKISCTQRCLWTLRWYCGWQCLYWMLADIMLCRGNVKDQWVDSLKFWLKPRKWISCRHDNNICAQTIITITFTLRNSFSTPYCYSALFYG